ncbi:MAG TPA: amidohydrolase family protein [Nocardioides sp.]|nr:amidohydrolase family protein [Nocardioides sp.]
MEERRERGVDVVKVMASGGMLTMGTDILGVQFSAAELRALVDAAHQADLTVLAHAHSLAGIEHALGAGVDGIEHFSGLVENGIRVPDEVLAQTAAAIGDLVAAGYPMAEALATATSLAAEACGLAEVTGSLRAGLAADVLVMDGDLRSGPNPLRSPVHVMVRGVSALP